MANHKSTVKAIRKNEIRRIQNRYQHKSSRTALKKLILEINKLMPNSGDISNESKKELFLHYSKVCSMIDKLAKKNIVHINKASRLKSRLRKKINFLMERSSETAK